MIQDLITRFHFWYIRNFIKLDVHYTFMLDLSDESKISVKILKRFPNTIVEYSNTRFDGNNQLVFDFDVVANPNLCNVESKRFKRFTSNIMRSIIIESLNNARKEKLNESREFNPIELDEEREFREEEPSVSQSRVSRRKPRKKTVPGD